jgi:TatA/E family protein of Tat protein translocase
MFGSLGVPELLLIFVVILIVFGPRRIPEIGRTLGKALGEFRKATDDLKSTIEREVRIEELKKITPPTLESFMTPSESIARNDAAATDATADGSSEVLGSSSSSEEAVSDAATPSSPEESQGTEEPVATDEPRATASAGAAE